MYRISVPVNYRLVTDENRHIYFEQLRELKAEKVFFFIPYLSMNPEVRKRWLDKFRYETAKFQEAGYKVGMWMWAFEREDASQFTLQRFFNGNEDRMRPCILDEDFLNDTAEWIKSVVAAGADFILFDDDTHINEAWYRGLACACPLHLKKYSEYIGRDVTEKEIEENVLVGERNEYRDAWLAVNRAALLGFADRIRAAVDEVNPEVRVGVCSVMSLWDVDGVDAYTYARHLAGNTKPFVRLIGAPYWAAKKQFGLRLCDVINLVRMEACWREDKDADIEVVGEGDTYPRPRFITPAAYAELYDMALRFTGETDGLLRYSIEYTSHPEYDMGYLNIYKSNNDIYSALEGVLSGGEMTGVRVYEALDKISDIKLPEKYVGNRYIEHLFYTPASKLLAHASLSTVYKGRGHGGIVFGHNAKMLTDEDISSGLILDMPAALELAERGVDVGLVSYKERGGSGLEYFCKTDHITSIGYEAPDTEYEIEVADGAIVTSRFAVSDGILNTIGSPAAYRYQNAKGQKFAVYAFPGYGCNDYRFYNYERGMQLRDDIEWLTGSPADAMCEGNPDLMLLTKKHSDGLSVALINGIEDPVLQPVIKLKDNYMTAEFVNCSGKIEGNELHLSRIEPFAFAGVRLKKQ